VDSVGRTTLEQVEPLLNSDITYNLLSRQSSFTVSRDGKILSYSNGSHLFSFDPNKQDKLLERKSLESGREKIRLDNGLTATLHDRAVTYHLPDGGPDVKVRIYTQPMDEPREFTPGHRSPEVQLRSFEGVSEISKAGKYTYNLNEGRTVLDNNLPKDARLHDPGATTQDAKNAINGADISFSRHVADMPRNKQVEYVTEVQHEVDQLEHDKAWNKREHLAFSLARDGSLKSVKMLNGSLLPWFQLTFDTTELYEAAQSRK
jgi:hypothetical protein